MDARDRSELQVLSAEVRGLSARMDLFAERQTNGIEQGKDHEARLRSMERWKYAIPGTLVLALVAAASTWR